MLAVFLQNMRYVDPEGSLSLPEGPWFWWKLIIALLLLAWTAREKYMLKKEKTVAQELSASVGVIMIWNYFMTVVKILLPYIVVIVFLLWFISKCRN